jgi:predicted glycoside hydrolase/deacetylase ChbG (UPF0249 family)
MKRLIINADDLGLTPGVTQGIIDAHLKGIVTSTSAMVNSPHIAESLEAASRLAPNLGIGIHLVLTWGKPLLPVEKVPLLVDEDGRFFKIHRLSGKPINLNEVHAEWQAQIESFLAAGRKPDHLDSHHHCSYSSQNLFAIMLELAQEYDFPIRFPSQPEGDFPAIEPLIQVLDRSSIRSPQSCITGFYDEGVSNTNLSEIISAIPDGVSEMMCHPGYAERELMESSTYAAKRELELQVLISPEIRKMLELQQVQLANFSELR